MDLKTQVQNFIEHPFPLWKTNLTQQIVQHKWRELQKKGFRNFTDYSTEGFWLGKPLSGIEKKEIAETALCIELPSFQMQSFYDEHGLEVLPQNEIETNAAILKLKNAISVLKLIKPAYDCIHELVHSIHVLRQPDVEVDLSYSHPQIPFSIFVSVCNDDSIISNLRVAESILHEAMHLKLTLIENIIPLVEPNTQFLFYSPWRDEQRSVGGVLHGLFVFRTIAEFYKDLLLKKRIPEAANFLRERISQIENELARLKDFRACSGMTEAGANLTENLLP